MLQFPALVGQWKPPPLTPTAVLLPVTASSQEDEVLLAMAESELQEKLNAIRKTNSNVLIIGKPNVDPKEETEGEADDEDADNGDESDGEEFEQETG